MARVELNKVSKRYPGAGELALDALTIDIADGEFFVLLGPSGCGKSTALRMIAGLESITSGTLSIGGEVMNTVPAKDRDIAMVFQTYALYPHMTVARNMGFGLRRRGFSRVEVSRRVGEVAAMLELSELLGRKPHALSGGQRQRVALGRAIVRDPEVFLFDEPLSNLDATLRLSTRNELVKLHRRIGTTMIYVTHDQVEAMTMGERICIMNNGKLAQIGTPLEVYRDPADMFVARFLGNPPMNLIGTVLRADGEALFADIGPAAIPLGGISREVAGRYAGRHVVLGIRPEDIYETERNTDIRKLAPLDATVVTVEALGAETLLNLDAPGLDDVFRARVGREVTVRASEPITVYLDSDALYLFDPETRRAIALSRTPPARTGKGNKRRPTG